MKISWDQCRPPVLQKHWNRVSSLAKEGFETAPSTQYYRRMEIGLFTRHFGPLRGKRLLKLDLWNERHNTQILDWACREGACVFGVDISDVITLKAAEIYRRKGLKAQFLIDDIRQLCFKDCSFDFVYTMGTIEHIPDYCCAVQEIYRVLARGGIALVGVPNKLDPFLRPLLVAVLDLFGAYPYSPEKSFTAGQLRRLLESSGFRVLDRTGIFFMPGLLRIVDVGLFRLQPRLCFLTRPLLALFEWFEARFQFLRERGYLIAYVVQKP